MRIRLRKGETFKTFAPKPEPSSDAARFFAVPIADLSQGEFGAAHQVFMGTRECRIFEIVSRRRIVDMKQDDLMAASEEEGLAIYAFLWLIEGEDGEDGRDWWKRYGRFHALADTALQIGDVQAIRLFNALLDAGYPKADDPFKAAKVALNSWAEAFRVLPDFLNDDDIGNVPGSVSESLAKLGISGDPFELFNVEAGIPALAQYARLIVESLPKAKPEKTKTDEGEARALALGPHASQALHLVVFEPLFAEPKERARTDGSTIRRGQRAIFHDVPAADADALLELTRGTNDFLSAEGIELFKFVMTEAHRRCEEIGSCSASPHIEMSFSELCQKVGAKDKKSAARVWPALKAGQCLRFSWPGVIDPIGLWLTSRKHARGEGQTDTIVIVPNAPLCPGFNRKFPSGDVGRFVAPIVKTPTLTKGTKTKTAETIFAARLSYYIARYSLEIYCGSGAPLSVQTLNELTGDLGLGSRGAGKAIKRWEGEMLEVWREGRSKFMVFAENETYGPAREMIREQGEIRASSTLRGRKSASKKAEARAKVLKKAWPKKAP